MLVVCNTFISVKTQTWPGSTRAEFFLYVSKITFSCQIVGSRYCKCSLLLCDPNISHVKQALVWIKAQYSQCEQSLLNQQQTLAKKTNISFEAKLRPLTELACLKFCEGHWDVGRVGL